MVNIILLKKIIYPQREQILFCKCSPFEKGGKYFHVRMISLTDLSSQLKDVVMTKSVLKPVKNVHVQTRPRGYKTFFMLNSGEHDIYFACKS